MIEKNKFLSNSFFGKTQPIVSHYHPVCLHIYKSLSAWELTCCLALVTGCNLYVTHES